MSKIPSASKFFSAETAELQLLVGQTVMLWQTIEFRACKLLWAFMYRPEEIIKWPVASAIYHQSHSFRARLAMVDAAAGQTLKGEHLQKWKKLESRLGQCAKKRNHAAHFALVHETAIKPTPEFRVFLEDLGVHDRAKPKQRLTKLDVKRNLADLSSLRDDLDVFLELLENQQI